MIKFSVVDWQIIATIAYCDQFDFPLTPSEVWQRLVPASELPGDIVPAQRQVAVPSQQFVESRVEALTRSRRLISDGEYVALPGRQQLFALRRQRLKIAAAKAPEVDTVYTWAHRIPWIQAVFLTGSFAMSNGEAQDDLDFMIVTTPGRLWLCRLLMIGVAWLYGKRRSWHGEEPGSWCFNLWVDTNHLELSPHQRSLYHAYEVIQARTVFDRNGVTAALYWQNRWVAQYIPQWRAPVKNARVSESRRTVFSALVDVLDTVLWHCQWWYMRPHHTSEKVARGYAFFHPRDTRKLLLTRWHKILERYQRTIQS